MWSRVWILLVCLVSLNGCATTVFQQAWVAPDAQAYPLGKTVAVAMLASEADRRRSEDLFAQVLAPAMDVSAAYAVAGAAPADPDTLDKVRAKARALGYGSVLVLRPVSSRDEVTYRPGPGYMFAPGWGYYGRHGYVGYPFMMDPGYFQKVRIVVVELSLYALKDDHLLWSANAEVVDSANVEGVVRRLADGMIKDLLARGLLP